MIAFENWPRWFRSMWPAEQKRWAVINAYRALSTPQNADLLTDIALRNYVFAPITETDPQRAAVAEGRRQCALEIFKLASVDPHALFARTRIDRD